MRILNLENLYSYQYIIFYHTQHTVETNLRIHNLTRNTIYKHTKKTTKNVSGATFIQTVCSNQNGQLAGAVKTTASQMKTDDPEFKAHHILSRADISFSSFRLIWILRFYLDPLTWFGSSDLIRIILVWFEICRLAARTLETCGADLKLAARMFKTRADLYLQSTVAFGHQTLLSEYLVIKDGGQGLSRLELFTLNMFNHTVILSEKIKQYQ